MNKKRFLTLLLAGALSLGLTACSGGDERGSSPTGDQSSSSTAEEPSSGTENSSKVEGFTLDTPTTADEAAEYFKQALLDVYKRQAWAFIASAWKVAGSSAATAPRT